MPDIYVTRHALDRYLLWERLRTGARPARAAAREVLQAEIEAALARGRDRAQEGTAARLVRLASPRRYYAVVAPQDEQGRAAPPDALLVVTVRPEHPGIYRAGPRR